MLAQIKSGDDDVWASMHTSGHLEGNPSDTLVGRLQRMRNWIEGPHFPDAAKVEVQSNVSEEARTNLTEEHKRFLSALSGELAQCEWTDSAIGDCIRKVAAKIGIGRRDVYTTIY